MLFNMQMNHVSMEMMEMERRENTVKFSIIFCALKTVEFAFLLNMKI